MGFIETPYRKVNNGKVEMKQLTFLSAEEEDTAKIAQANTPLDEKGNFYDRYEAYDIAMTNGQMSATARHYKMDKRERELFSEDLY